MQKLRRFAALLIAAILVVAMPLTACGGSTNSAASSVSAEPESFGITPAEKPVSIQATTQAPDESAVAAEVSTASEVPAPDTGSNILIAYFAYGENAGLPAGVDASASASIQPWGDTVTGNTGVVAHMIADATGGDLFSIRTVEPYPDNYDDTIDVGRDEKNNDARPALASRLETLEPYDTIFLGYPNWWSDMPMAVYSFLDAYDLSGKTVIPFVTSGGSGFSNTLSAIEDAEPDATVLEGLSLGAAESTNAEAEVISWLQDLGYAG